ncbi:MAG: hypothetical protein PVI90_01265 [Desulfobacteraceae bacterium]|jgi:hypothetical protein
MEDQKKGLDGNHSTRKPMRQNIQSPLNNLFDVLIGKAIFSGPHESMDDLKKISGGHWNVPPDF